MDVHSDVDDSMDHEDVAIPQSTVAVSLSFIEHWYWSPCTHRDNLALKRSQLFKEESLASMWKIGNNFRKDSCELENFSIQ